MFMHRPPQRISYQILKGVVRSRAEMDAAVDACYQRSLDIKDIEAAAQSAATIFMDYIMKRMPRLTRIILVQLRNIYVETYIQWFPFCVQSIETQMFLLDKVKEKEKKNGKRTDI